MKPIPTSRRGLTALTIGLLLAGGTAFYVTQSDGKSQPEFDFMNQTGGTIADTEPAAGEDGMPTGFAGTYLSSHFAQNQSNWVQAADMIDRLLDHDPDNFELVRQSMVLAAAAGEFDLAAERAAALLKSNNADPLSSLIVATRALQRHDYKSAVATLQSIPSNDMNAFVTPLFLGWAHAGQGIAKTDIMKGSSIHAYHGGLIAYALKLPGAAIAGFARAILVPGSLNAQDAERAADLMTLAGQDKDAAKLYQSLIDQDAGSDRIAKKLNAIGNRPIPAALIPGVETADAGRAAGLALLDLANILYQEESNQSAIIFAQMALALNPDLMDARILIADLHARSNQIEQAITEYKSIPGDSPLYIHARHRAADFLARNSRYDEAIALLQDAYDSHKNPETLIRQGDLHRGAEHYTKALAIYDKVLDILPKPLPAKDWYILYARGMTLERLKRWPEAEKDLEAALALRPDHAHLMNYLAYGWADQGVNLDKALKMLEDAVSLNPEDGYIIDSLGWAHYKIGNFDEAIPYLERAVALMPYDPTVNDHLGDAYWRVGRKTEARYQWDRARLYTKDSTELKAIDTKIASGLAPGTPAAQ